MGNRERRGERGSRARSSDAGSFDRPTSADDILRDLDGTVETLGRSVSALVDSLDEQTALDVDVTQTPPAERPYNFSQTIPADTPLNQPETEEWEIPHDGTVTKVILGWPDGAQQAAGIGVRGTQGESLIPAGPSGVKFLGLNDKVLTFSLDDGVRKDESYTFRFANTDPDNDHFVNVIPVLSRGD